MSQISFTHAFDPAPAGWFFVPEKEAAASGISSLLRQAPSGDPKVRSTLASPHFYVNHGAYARTSPTDRASNDARIAVAARR